jgi:hypothetical protein
MPTVPWPASRPTTIPVHWASVFHFCVFLYVCIDCVYEECFRKQSQTLLHSDCTISHSTSTMIFLFCFVFLWDWSVNSGLELAKQAPYHLSHTTSPPRHHESSRSSASLPTHFTFGHSNRCVEVQHWLCICISQRTQDGRHLFIYLIAIHELF